MVYGIKVGECSSYYHVALFALFATFSRFDTIPACDWQQKDGQPDGHTMTANNRASIASRVKTLW